MERRFVFAGLFAATFIRSLILSEGFILRKHSYKIILNNGHNNYLNFSCGGKDGLELFHCQWN
ncbi:hypothetical protein PbJCM17693_27610 [Paenibacillus macerans]|nr:hypothetical protein PbJCM17693_27610 [Paenibacillus macerans]